ncbi:hypothetical protein LO762_18155 [Actinocorallia sp. API 0066]|uniref:hypothetical protein n=1 Tax=Actinocorallia sp. API 0066 TaxID=2896846 RepID=UPI001E61DD6B|nr:hypothetical protein [Actinocorallia sp. API 0066]MCD0451106.1 hypothetical protein [Actinocorallia sp. API 0066]
MSLVLRARPSLDPLTGGGNHSVRLLLLGWLGQAVVRWGLAWHRLGPTAHPDEAGYLVAARLLAGGPGADLSGHTFYQGGYPLLLTPVFWVTEDPVLVYRLVMLVNALVGALALPLAYVALKRIGLTSMPLAWAASLLPAVVVFGRHALADAVLPVVVLAWLLALGRFLDGRGAAVPASLLACYAWAVHARGAVLLAVHVVALLLAVRGRRRPAFAGLAVVAAGCWAVVRLNGLLLARLYPDGALDLGGTLLDRMLSVDGQLWALSGAAGQLWYMIAATWGLAGVGLVVVVAAAVRGHPLALVLCAVTFGIAYASMAALPDENRVGNFAYGRYLACFALVHALVGLRALADRRAVLGAVVGLAVTARVVAGYAGGRLEDAVFIAFDFPEIIFLTGEDDALELGAATASAAALLAVLALVQRRALVLALVNLVALTSVTAPWRAEQVPDAGLPEGGVLTARDVPWQARAALYHRVSWTRIGWYETGDSVHPGVCAVLVPWRPGAPIELTWPGHPVAWRPLPSVPGTVVWTCRAS